MSYPYRFNAGDIARSEEINANMDYFLDLIGQNSIPGSIAGQTQFVLGPRQNGIISSRGDTGSSDDTAFIQIMWNASWSYVTSAYKYGRVVPNTNAAALRIGKKGLRYLATSQTTGDLHSQMTTVFNVSSTYFYLRGDVHFQTVDEAADNIQDYRLMQVFLETPIKIYNGPIGGGSTTLNAYTMGVPNTAKGITIYAHVTPAGASGAGMHFYQKRSTAVTDLDRARGYVIHGYSGNTATGRVGGQGVVPLATNGQFVVERTASFALAKVYIMGYLT